MNHSDNNDRPERDIQSIQEKTRNYILSNLLSVLSVTSLLVGGIIFWLYFFNIQYLPDLNFNDSILFLFVAAITGIYFLLSLGIILTAGYLPRLLVVMLNTQQKTFDPKKSKLFIPVITGSDGISNNEKDLSKEILWYFVSLFIISFVLYYLYLQSISVFILMLIFLAICFFAISFLFPTKSK